MGLGGLGGLDVSRLGILSIEGFGALRVGGFRVLRIDGLRAGEFREEHGAGSGLIEPDEFDFDFLAEFFAGVVDNNHRAVAQIRDALMRVAADGDDFDLGALAGEILIAQRKRELIEVECVDMLGRCNFGEVVIVGEDETVIGFGEFHEAIVDGRAVELVVQDGGVEENYALELAHRVEAGAGAETFLGVFAVGKELKLVGDAARDDNVVADETGFGNFNQARVHEGGGVNINFALLVRGDEGVFATFKH